VVITQDLAPNPDEFFTHGVDITSQPDFRWSKCNVKSVSLLPAILTLNNLPPDAIESVFYDEDSKIVRECASSNIFCVKDGWVYTPPLSRHILPGVERQTIINLAKENSIPLKEEDFTLEFLKNADEVFMSSTTKELVAVKKIDDAVIASSPGPLTKRLSKIFVVYVEKELGLEHHKRSFIDGW